MFGYIRPYKPYMREFEYEIYQSFYCGLCKDLGKNYGQIFRLFLSYDFTFLSLMCNSLNIKSCHMERQRCIVHPIKKRYCVCCGNDYEYTSAAAVISVYHKISDEAEDNRGVKKLFYSLLKKLIKKAYRKASCKLPFLADRVEYFMKMQTELEKEKCSSIDKACEPTARIMGTIAQEITDDKDKQKHLYGFGYHLGRFIYLADAHDDLEKDIKKNNYNPLSLNFSDIEEAKKLALNSINMSLGQAAEEYTKCGFCRFKDILDNVLYLGMPKFSDIGKKDKKGSIDI